MSFIPQERARLSYNQQHPLHNSFPTQITPTRQLQQGPTSTFSIQSQNPSHSHPDPINALSQVTTPNTISQGAGATPLTQSQEASFIYQLREASNAITPTPSVGPRPPQQTSQDAREESASSSAANNAAQPTTPNNAVSTPFDESPIVMMPNLTIESMFPPPEHSYATFEALLHYSNRFAFAHGYALVIGRSKRGNGPAGFKKVLLACDRAGTNKHINLPPDHLRKRKTTSRKTDCKFGVYAIEGPMEWKVQIRPDPQYAQHNHGPSKDVSEHPAARKLNPSAVAAVKALKDAGLSVQETVKQIQLAQPGARLIARDVYNARAALRREPERDAQIDPGNAPPQIYRRANMTAEERLRDDCRMEVAKIKEELDEVRQTSGKELEKLRAESGREIERLRGELREKDKTIEKFEMFIDICNQRVMVQRSRLSDNLNEQDGGAPGASA